MQLIGMLDSPYVRRVAVSLNLMRIPYEHRPISVLSGMEEFRAINPVVKAPSLVCDDGGVLMESTLILEYLEEIVRPSRSLMPTEDVARRRALYLTGLALAACEKTVQIVYECNLRPKEKQYQPWLIRIESQLLAAYKALDAELRRAPLESQSETITNAGVAVGVAWAFTQFVIPEIVPAAHHGYVREFSDLVACLPEFSSAAIPVAV